MFECTEFSWVSKAGVMFAPVELVSNVRGYLFRSRACLDQRRLSLTV